MGRRDPNRFAAASEDEKIVFGARRPGYESTSVSDGLVTEWIDSMKNAGIERVVCLLMPSELEFYSGLLSAYETAFGEENVLSAGVEDYHLAEPDVLANIMNFLKDSDNHGARTVVHCAGGSGRTGHILAAWLVQGRRRDVDEALTIVALTRNPRWAVLAGNATEHQLRELLAGVAVN